GGGVRPSRLGSRFWAAAHVFVNALGQTDEGTRPKDIPHGGGSRGTGGRPGFRHGHAPRSRSEGRRKPGSGPVVPVPWGPCPDGTVLPEGEHPGTRHSMEAVLRRQGNAAVRPLSRTGRQEGNGRTSGHRPGSGPPSTGRREAPGSGVLQRCFLRPGL